MASVAIPVTETDTSAAQVRTRSLACARLAFVDNLRNLLVVLVILHHLAVTYGATGGWYYREGRAGPITAMVLTLFVVINQSFFMGLYFLIAAHFVPPSLEAKGSKQFLKDRCVRLGLPLAFQLLVIAPLLSYGLAVTVWGSNLSLGQYLVDYVRNYRGPDSGPLWFVEALLIFSILYALWWALAGRRAGEVRREGAVPGNLAIAAFALTVGLVTFVIRIWLPVGWFLAPLNFQIPYFPQYISLFIVGTVAYRRGWLSAIAQDQARGRLWGRVVVLLIILAPVLFVLGGALGGDTGPFLGGLHWQALAYALFEQFLCVAMAISLLVWFRRKQDHQGRLAREISASAYAVYICHAPILVCVSVGLGSLAIHPLLKFALAALICLPVCFLVGGLARRLPGVKQVL